MSNFLESKKYSQGIKNGLMLVVKRRKKLFPVCLASKIYQEKWSERVRPARPLQCGIWHQILTLHSVWLWESGPASIGLKKLCILGLGRKLSQ